MKRRFFYFCLPDALDKTDFLSDSLPVGSLEARQLTERFVCICVCCACAPSEGQDGEIPEKGCNETQERVGWEDLHPLSRTKGDRRGENSVTMIVASRL